MTFYDLHVPMNAHVTSESYTHSTLSGEDQYNIISFSVHKLDTVPPIVGGAVIVVSLAQPHLETLSDTPKQPKKRAFF